MNIVENVTQAETITTITCTDAEVRDVNRVIRQGRGFIMSSSLCTVIDNDGQRVPGFRIVHCEYR